MTVLTAAAKTARNRYEALTSRGHAVHCPICGHSWAKFAPRGKRQDAACPGCRSLERHRAFWLYATRSTDLFSAPHRVLHFAPEQELERRLRPLRNLRYTTADLLRGDVDLRLDACDTGLPDGSFDVVLCSHVLEHVPDDKQAMRELLRITSRGGWALLTTPVEEQRDCTYEDASITDPLARRKAFGQEDHVRRYGRNFPDLLADAGWDVVVRPLALSEEEAARFGIPEREQRLYVARRP